MLAAALAPKFLLVYAYLASALWVHFRGRVRHGFGRQLTDHSTLFAPINCFMYLLSAVPARPYLDVRDFPALAPLRENWHVLREEALQLHDGGDIRASDRLDDIGFNSFFRRGWKRFYLKWYGAAQPSARALCPRSVALVESIPSIKAAMFAVLPPGGKLVAHRDPYAGSLRYHLGLVTPNNDRCRLVVDGQAYSWRDGEAVIFDETYIHHAENFAKTDRIILFCDVERPMRFGWARAANRLFATYVLRAGATQNRDGDRVGALNRIFGSVYQVRIWAKKLKQRDKRAYYVLKYGSLAFWVGVFLYFA